MKITQVEPTDDRVLILPNAAETKTASGLYIPDAAKEKPKTGVVVAIGPEVENMKPGDDVLYGKFAGSEIDCISPEGLKLNPLIMRRTDVISIISKENE